MAGCGMAVFSLVLWDLIISLICSTSIAMNIDGGAIKILNHWLLRYIAFGLVQLCVEMGFTWTILGKQKSCFLHFYQILVFKICLKYLQLLPRLQHPWPSVSWNRLSEQVHEYLDEICVSRLSWREFLGIHPSKIMKISMHKKKKLLAWFECSGLMFRWKNFHCMWVGWFRIAGMQKLIIVSRIISESHARRYFFAVN